MFDSFSPRVRRASASVRERSRAFASVRGVSAWAWLLIAAIQRVSSVSARARVWTVRVAGVGNRGSVCAALDRGMAFRVAAVGNGG